MMQMSSELWPKGGDRHAGEEDGQEVDRKEVDGQEEREEEVVLLGAGAPEKSVPPGSRPADGNRSGPRPTFPPDLTPKPTMPSDSVPRGPARAELELVRVRVPASSANLGPGFDAVGLALGLFNTVVLERAAAWEVDGERDPARLASHPAYRGARRALAWLERRGLAPAGGFPALAIRQHNEIPAGRGGLGNSATAVVAGLVGAARLAGHPLAEADLLDLAAEIEGHPDNAAAAVMGGLVVAIRTERGVVARGVPLVNPPRVVLAIPATQVETARARARLPASLPFADAAFTVGRASLLVAALATGDHAVLRVAMEDRLHTPYRAPLVPGLEAALAAGREAGALGAALSGSGPTVLAFVPGGAPDLERAVGAALAGAFGRHGLPCDIRAVDVEPAGAVVLE